MLYLNPVNKMAPLDLSSILKNCEGKWVALSDDNTIVYGIGKTAMEAAQDARSKGFSEFTLLFVEPSDIQDLVAKLPF